MFASTVARTVRSSGRTMATAAKRSWEMTSVEHWTKDVAAYPIMIIAVGAGCMSATFMYYTLSQDPELKVSPENRKTTLRGELSFKL